MRRLMRARAGALLGAPQGLQGEALDRWLDSRDKDEPRGFTARVRAAGGADEPARKCTRQRERLHDWTARRLRELDDVKALATRIRAEVGKAITGQVDTVDLMLTALFAGGHILLEGPPGTAKTMIARCFAQALGVVYGRIQFTPDLMPGDIVGSNIYNFQTGQFTLTRGRSSATCCSPTRSTARRRRPRRRCWRPCRNTPSPSTAPPIRSARNFMVVATQNPIEHQGVYPLPEAQLDRFLFKHRVSYPAVEEERAIIARHGGGTPVARIRAATTSSRRPTARRWRRRSRPSARSPSSTTWSAISPRWCARTRESAELEVGASPRAGAMLARAARARAALDGRAYVIPDDVKALAVPALRHRVILSPAAQIDGRQVEQIVADLVDADGSAALIYPSSRAVWAAAAGAVPAFLVALALPSLWYLGLLWICVLLAFLAVDAAAGPAGIADRQPAGAAAGRRRRAVRRPCRRPLCRPRAAPSIEARVGHDDAPGAARPPRRALVPTPAAARSTCASSAVRRGTGELRPAVAALARAVRAGLEAGRAARRTARWRCCPTSASARDEAILFLQRDALPDGHAQRRAGQGREFEALKDYQPGMGRRMIDWKRSARHGKLLAREFRVEQNNNIVLAIDSGRLMCEPVDGVPKVDRAVTAALLSAFIALKGGDLVSLFSFDARPRVTSGAVRGSGKLRDDPEAGGRDRLFQRGDQFHPGPDHACGAARPALAGRHLHRFRRSDQRRADAAHRRAAHRAASGAVHDDEGRGAGDIGRHARLRRPRTSPAPSSPAACCASGRW